MDNGDKFIVGLLTAALLFVATAIVFSNLRWRANMRGYQENGYTQKQVVSGYKTIWVLDPNSKD